MFQTGTGKQEEKQEEEMLLTGPAPSDFFSFLSNTAQAYLPRWMTTPIAGWTLLWRLGMKKCYTDLATCHSDLEDSSVVTSASQMTLGLCQVER